MIDLKHRHLSRLSIERYLLGEMINEEESRVKDAIDQCDTCRDLVSFTRSDNEAFAMRPIPERIIELGKRPSNPGWKRGVYILAPAAAMAAVALLMFAPTESSEKGVEKLGDIPSIGNRDIPGTVRLKGKEDSFVQGDASGLDFGFYLLKGENNNLGHPGQHLKEGDRIQFWYDAPRSESAVVIGIDSRGVVTRYAPVSGGGHLKLEPGRGKVISSSVILDDAKGPERFFLCAGKKDKCTPQIVEKAAREIVGFGISLKDVTRLPIECEQASVWIEKE